VRIATPFLAALLIGLALRAATLPLPGHEDVVTWKIWSYGAAHDVTAMYGIGGTPPTRGVVTWGERWTTVDYPPMFLYEYAIVGRIFQRVFPSFPDSTALLVAVKLPVLLANIGVTALLFFVARRIAGDAAARWAALAYWLNPATLFGGEMLGYVDPLYTLPSLAGLALAYFGRPWAAGALIGVAIATKPQGILIGPAFALLLWQSGGVEDLARAAATFAAAVALIVLPFYLRGAVPNMWLAFGSFEWRRDTMSAYAANIGWIVNWWLRSRFGVPELGARAFLQMVPRPLAISRFRELGYPDPRLPGHLAVLAATGWAVWRARRVRDLAVAAAVGAFTIDAFFVLSVNIHEHHQLFAIPLLVLAGALRPGFRPLCVVLSAIVALNINAIYGFGLGIGWAVPRTITGIDLTVLLAFVNIGVLIWFARIIQRQTTVAA
jgi:4-amino-4-deoxy-L-arabinose transferase-like glycosyltransferase